jgi:hypothetical protein
MLNPPFNLAKILRFERATICSKVGISAKFSWLLAAQQNHEFANIVAHSNLNIFARFKGGFNMNFSVLSNTRLNVCQKKNFVKLKN